MEPTSDLYGFLQDIYAHFNDELFDGSLPNVMFTTQRKKGMCGHFSAERWASSSKQEESEVSHEISINPEYFGSSPLIEIFQTMVHEMCHLKQHIDGTSSRSGYHNKKFAELMESVGLMPSHTGRPGGKKTGDKMSDYPIPGGVFLAVCESLVTGEKRIPWIDRHVRFNPAGSESEAEACEPNEVGYEQSDTQSTIEGVELDASEALTTSLGEYVPSEMLLVKESVPAKKTKITYHCQTCSINVWGKPGLKLICGECNNQFESN